MPANSWPNIEPGDGVPERHRAGDHRRCRDADGRAGTLLVAFLMGGYADGAATAHPPPPPSRPASRGSGSRSNSLFSTSRNSPPRLQPLARDEQDFLLGWIRRIASHPHPDRLAVRRRAPRAADAHGAAPDRGLGAAHLDVFDRSGLRHALRVMERSTPSTKRSMARRSRGRVRGIAAVMLNFVHGLSGRRLASSRAMPPAPTAKRSCCRAVIAALQPATTTFSSAKAMVAMMWAQTRFGSLRIDLRQLRPYDDPERASAALPGTGNAAAESLHRARTARPAPRDAATARAARITPCRQWQRFARNWRTRGHVDDSLRLLDAAYAEAECPQWRDQGELRPDAIAAARAARMDKEKIRLRVKLANCWNENTTAQPKPRPAGEVRPELKNRETEHENGLSTGTHPRWRPIAPPEGVRSC